MAQTFSNILIYEDSLARSRRFLPLTYTRCVAELRSGAVTGIERVRTIFPDTRLFLHTRPELAEVVRHRHLLPVNEVPAGPSLAINAREALSLQPNAELQTFDTLPTAMSESLTAGAAIEPVLPVPGNAPSSLWGIVHVNSEILRQDIELHREQLLAKRDAAVRPGVHMINPKDIFLAHDSRIDPGVVLDASDGPILVEHRTHIMPNSTILGPVAICPDCIIKAGAKIYGGTTIGPVSKVGGEIENSIVQGYSNKQHDGYLGHSYLGEWVNLGAGTNTSDLKNDYSTVRVSVDGEEFDTTSLFAGLFMGDHSKSAIGSRFNSGTVVGVGCNIFCVDFPPKWIPNFSWVGANGIEKYRIEKALAVARTVTLRRSTSLSNAEEILLRSLAL